MKSQLLAATAVALLAFAPAVAQDAKPTPAEAKAFVEKAEAELAAFTGETKTDASAVADYFKPLNIWLTAQNKGEKCGW